MMQIAVIAFTCGTLFGMGVYWLSHWRWRTMYYGGKAECWRCHGSGREGR